MTVTDRRTIVRAAAWTAPVVAYAATAPPMAASPCQDNHTFTLQWGTTAYAVNNHVGAATVTGPNGTQPVTATLTSTVAGANITRAADNLSVSSLTDIGGLGAGEQGLKLSHAAPITSSRSNRQDVAISFSRAVTGLTFTITDIDSHDETPAGPGGADWWDRVELTGTRTYSAASNINGTGVQSDAWRIDTSNTTIPDTGNSAGNVRVTYAATIPASTPVTLTFWTFRGGGAQEIYLGDFTFTAIGC